MSRAASPTSSGRGAARKERAGLPILAFASAASWEDWLARQPRNSPGLWLKLAKKNAETPSVSKPEAIDGALIHGWIDGQLGALDNEYFLVRFTPRRPNSKWSRVNRDRAEKLIAAGRMTPAGVAEVESAKADGRWAAAYQPQSRADVPEDLRQALAASPKARNFFEELDSANHYAILYRLHHAKEGAPRAARLAKFVAMLEAGETFHPVRAKRRKPK